MRTGLQAEITDLGAAGRQLGENLETQRAVLQRQKADAEHFASEADSLREETNNLREESFALRAKLAAHAANAGSSHDAKNTKEEGVHYEETNPKTQVINIDAKALVGAHLLCAALGRWSEVASSSLPVSDCTNTHSGSSSSSDCSPAHLPPIILPSQHEPADSSDRRTKWRFEPALPGSVIADSARRRGRASEIRQREIILQEMEAMQEPGLGEQRRSSKTPMSSPPDIRQQPSPPDTPEHPSADELLPLQGLPLDAPSPTISGSYISPEAVNGLLAGYTCSICLEQLTGKGIVITECGHGFHWSCLSRAGGSFCPQCRQPLDDDPAFPPADDTSEPDPWTHDSMISAIGHMEVHIEVLARDRFFPFPFLDAISPLLEMRNLSGHAMPPSLGLPFMFAPLQVQAPAHVQAFPAHLHRAPMQVVGSTSVPSIHPSMGWMGP
jgi:hypothetical protein